MKNIILGMVAVVGIIFIGNWALANVEQRECSTWNQEAEDPGKTFVDWQYQQCEHHNNPLPKREKVESGPVEVIFDPETVEVKSLTTWQGGTASWYDYDLKDNPGWSKNHRTAASRDYPRGTMLTVCTDPSETKCVDVLVNDYGPSASVHPDRIIDLSSYAFSKLYPLSQGVGEVWIKN